MASHLEIKELQQQHIQEAADVLTRSFLNLNDIWKKYNPTYQQIFPIMRGRILPSISDKWSFVLLKDGKVIGLALQYQMLDYINLPSMPSNLQLFAKLGKAGKQLQKKINLSELNRGDAIYGLFGVIDPKQAANGYSLKFWWHLFSLGKLAGWRYYYSRISSPVSLKMLQKLGAQVLGEVSVDQQTNEKLWMIRIDLLKPFPSYSMLSAMTQKKPKQEQASL